MDDTEQYIEQQIADGYIKADGAPLKCQCGSTNLDWKHIYEGMGVVEIEVKCNDCGKDVGLWSYGSWTL